MPIIIIADMPEGEVPPPATTTPATPATPPAATIAPEPPKPKNKKEPNKYFDTINSIVAEYAQGRLDGKSETELEPLVDRVWAYPYGKTGTIGDFLTSNATRNKDQIENPDLWAKDCMREWMFASGKRSLENLKNQDNPQNADFIGYLGQVHKKLWAGLPSAGSKNPWGSQKAIQKQKNYLEEYVRGVLGMPGGEEIPEDILDNPSMSDDEKVWAAVRRKKFNDYPTPDGKGRIQTAIEKVYSEIMRVRPDLKYQLKPSSIISKFKEDLGLVDVLKNSGVDLRTEDPSSPYWLTMEMTNPEKRHLGAPAAKAVREKLLGNTGGVNIGGLEGDEGSDRFDPSEKLQKTPDNEGKKGKFPAPENSRSVFMPYEVVSDKIKGVYDFFGPDSPKVQEALEEDGIPYEESAASLIRNRIDDRRKILSAWGPYFRKVMEYMIDDYDDNDPRRAICTILAGDALGVPKSGSKNSMDVLRERAKSLPEHPEFQQVQYQRPLKGEPPKMTNVQRFNYYTGKVADDLKDILISDDGRFEDMAEAVGFDQTRLAEIRRQLRVAAFLLASIRRG